MLLHPYDEALWDDQVLKEPLALRVCRATNHLKLDLLSGFTTLRDLGTEGAGLRRRRPEAGGRTGDRPRPPAAGGHPGDRRDGHLRPERLRTRNGTSPRAPRRPTARRLRRVVRDQIGRGADWIKVYADTAMGGDLPRRRRRS